MSTTAPTPFAANLKDHHLNTAIDIGGFTFSLEGHDENVSQHVVEAVVEWLCAEWEREHEASSLQGSPLQRGEITT